jgi:hypothetical protein
MAAIDETQLKHTTSKDSVAAIKQDAQQYEELFPLARALSPERRKEVEKSLKRKLDLRCSLFVVIYIMSEWRGVWIVIRRAGLTLTNHLRLPRPKQHRRRPIERSPDRPQSR